MPRSTSREPTAHHYDREHLIELIDDQPYDDVELSDVWRKVPTLSLQARSQRAQIIRHIAELSDHLGVAEIAGGRITGAAECDCTCMTQYFARAFRTPYRCCGAWALDRFTNNNAAVSNIERQGNEIGNSGHDTHPRILTSEIVFPFCSRVNSKPCVLI